uniref:Triple QxxK/R motif-containing protein n=1 Tax=Anser brachyrhynchus TaxID=132585 RepID=A0A8B9CHW2_9AVES
MMDFKHVWYAITYFFKSKAVKLYFIALAESIESGGGSGYVLVFVWILLSRDGRGVCSMPCAVENDGKQDYKKTRPMLRATRLKAEAKKTALGVKEVALVLAAILVFLLAFYAFFYLNISNEVDLDLDPDEN